MPRLEPVGRIADLDELDLDPVIVPVIGYTADKEEVIFEVSFRGMEPTGSAVDMVRRVDSSGNIPLGLVFDYLDACVVEEQRDEWSAWLHSPDVFIERDTLIEVYRSIVSYYSARPTKQRSVSHNGRVTSGPTSRAAAPSPVSTSLGSRSGEAWT